MKPITHHILLLVAGIFIHLQAVASPAKTIASKPDRVTVYLSGAELTHTETVALAAGTNTIIIEGIAPGADENTISAFLKGALILDTKKEFRYPENKNVFTDDRKYAAIIKRITDSLEDVSWLLRECDDKQAVLAKEKYLLLNNRLMRGEFKRDSIDLLKASLDLLKSRLSLINSEELSVDRRESNLQKLQKELGDRKQYYVNLQNNNMNNLHTEKYIPIYYITITAEAEAATTSSLTLKYFTPSAGWMPRYDIIAGSGSQSIELLHRAQVYQNTGVEWKNVNLTLSTSNPSVGNTKPFLNAWNLIFGYPNTYSEQINKKNKTIYNYDQYRPQLAEVHVEAASNGNATMKTEPAFVMSGNFLRTEYSIKTKYTVSSDNKAHNVLISKNEVPVKLTYMAVPKLDNDAFLMGKISNWEDLNLLPASARIYFDESYIGLTAIEPETTRDTLYLNLGRDRSLVIKRIALKDKCKDQVIGDQRTHIKTFEITVRNTKSIALDFEIEDQIPVTRDQQIKISLLDKDGAIYDEVSGKLTWKLKIKPKDSKKIVFSYEVKYPKDKFIQGL